MTSTVSSHSPGEAAIHGVGPVTPLPAEPPAAQMHAFLRVYVALHDHAQELFDSLSREDPLSPEWMRRWDDVMALNALATEAQMCLKDAMTGAGAVHVEAGGWQATLLPLHGSARAIYAHVERIEHTGAGQ